MDTDDRRMKGAEMRALLVSRSMEASFPRETVICTAAHRWTGQDNRMFRMRIADTGALKLHAGAKRTEGTDKTCR
jgi:hypothetical protein